MTEFAKDDMARRLDAFVDAAFAFAVTLLVVGGGDPPASLSELSDMLLRAPAYGAAFALIVMFWLGYRDLGRLWPHRDGLSTALSLAVVFVVLLYVFPLRLIMESALHALSGGILPGSALAGGLSDMRFLYAAYGFGGLILATLFALLYRHHLGQGEVSAARTHSARIWIGNWSILALVSLASILLAVWAPDRFATWMPGFVYMSVPILIGLTMTLRDRRMSDAPGEIDTGATSP